jgi:hypothetical protein
VRIEYQRRDAVVSRQYLFVNERPREQADSHAAAKEPVIIGF